MCAPQAADRLPYVAADGSDTCAGTAIFGTPGPAPPSSIRPPSRGVLESMERRAVGLPHPINVHLTYLTAWVNKDGSVHYRRDIYGRDKILAKALAKQS